MWYEEVKVYHDGSHYVGIPHTTNPKKRRKQPPEQEFEVVEESVAEKTGQEDKAEINAALVSSFEGNQETYADKSSPFDKEPEKKPVIRKVTDRASLKGCIMKAGK